MIDEVYRPRPIRCLEIWSSEGWRLKVYGISCRAGKPRAGLVKAAKSLAASLLPQPPAADGRYGVGFLGVHDGRDANLVFVDWWADENELHHHVFLSASDAPTRLWPAEPGELTACVWDLAVIGFERDAWVESVLRHSGVPNLDGYLAMQLSGEA